MLTGIGLRNFKAFGDEMQEAPLSKITLIYGPNSGGKSSVIQALLLLKQSLNSTYDDHKRSLIPRGELVDLGSLRSLLHRHDEERTLGIELSYINNEQDARDRIHMKFSPQGILLEVHYKIVSKDSSDVLFTAVVEGDLPESYRFGGRSLDWSARFRILNVDGERILNHFHDDFLPTLGFYEFELVRLRERSQTLQGLMENAKKALERTGAFVLGQDFDLTPVNQPYARTWAFHETREQALEQARVRAQQTREEILEVKRSWKQHQLMNQIMEQREVQTLGQAFEKAMERAKEEIDEELDPALEQLDPIPEHIIALTPENIPADYERHLHSVNYLAPLRSAPERLYRLSSEIDSSTGMTGIQGEFSASVLYHSEEVRDAVNLRFEQFDIPYELDVIRLGEASLAGEHITIALYLLDRERNRIVDSNGKEVTVTLADVGYGINQLLPIIIEGIASQEGSIICVEQPEIHLHPRLQANIADLMIDTIANEPGKRKQWIVETHSELLILRLQRRIREGKIKPEDISVLYVDPNDESTEGSAIIPLRMDENGDFIDEWPQGFFDESFNELMAEPERHLHPAD